MGMGTFIIEHPDFGWQAFGGIVTSSNPTVRVSVRDSVRRRVFIAPLGALLTLDAGAFESVTFDPEVLTVVVTIVPAPDGISAAAKAPNARLVVRQTASVAGVGTLKATTSVTSDAGAMVAPFSNGVATIELSAK